MGFWGKAKARLNYRIDILSYRVVIPDGILVPGYQRNQYLHLGFHYISQTISRIVFQKPSN